MLVRLRFLHSLYLGGHLNLTMFFPAETTLPEVIARSPFSVQLKLVCVLHLLGFQFRAADKLLVLTFKSLQRQYGSA